MNSVLLAAAGSSSVNAGGVILDIAVVIAGIILYWLPSLIAWRRKPPSVATVVVVNLFTGWTVIGWIVALAMAMRDPRPAPQPPAATR